MLEFLPSSPDVIALRVGGRLAAGELDEVVARVERSLEERETTHLFVEVDAFSGLELGASPAYLPRAAAMLGKLRRFGRVAIVAGQGWVRWASRIESALLPGIRYEIFAPGERDRALDWVEGREPRPHRPAIRIIDTDRPEVLGFELDGRIGADEVAAALAWLEEAGRPLRLLGRIRQVGGIDPEALFSRDYVAMKLRALHSVERYALVGGPDWLRGWVGLIAPLVRMEMRWFAPADEASAWAWLGATPKAEHPLAA